MFYRQKLMLGLLEVLDKNLDNIDFQKYLFLYNELCYTKNERLYDFVPYKYGCFSFQSYADLRSLKEMGFLKKDNLSLMENKSYFQQLTKTDQQKLLYFKKHYATKKGKELIKFVYANYPYYTLKSEIYNQIMPYDSPKFQITNKEEPMLFTIGYEGKSIDRYLNELILNNIKLVCDVRRNPLSRKYGFSKTSMQKIMEKMGIIYLNIPQLGISSDQRTELNTIDDYNKLFSIYEKTTLANSDKYLDEILKLISKYKRIALTCFEADYHMCHRARVAHAIIKKIPTLNLEHI